MKINKDFLKVVVITHFDFQMDIKFTYMLCIFVKQYVREFLFVKSFITSEDVDSACPLTTSLQTPGEQSTWLNHSEGLEV